MGNIFTKIKSALRETLKIKQGERVLIVTDLRMHPIAVKFLNAAKALSGNVKILVIKQTQRHGAEPKKEEALAMRGHDALILLVTNSLTHTDARRASSLGGARIASMPSFSLKMMHALAVDYKKMRAHSHKLLKELNKARKDGTIFHITSPSGTDLRLKILEKVYIDDGDIKEDGVANLPAGEVFFAPKDAEGVLVVDRYENKIRKPTILVIKDNAISSFPGSREGKILKKMFSVPGGNFVAEFGIGTNQNATIIGNTLQDEKVKGTAHVAFGNNVSMGGKNNAKVHVDTILLRPTIRVGSRVLMRDGKALW
ncbi:MAG TPA: aminopeptidase [Nanoarchaeota archaeon]|nr:aminopeptidase [Candidatus Pacearchaeota archaeon]HIH17759.1 aminopeptidase [Nanoarchaeota archaeon]HIH33784.1 aminopeptidase [Nanoarchaeota archaeon]HIH50804.1 aminopeptidase [Nanoarchaeota archaeon]HIH66454.1 aminopeptidase [Nanoarchaeota archaeon]